jgi:hypothetical protein
MLRIAIWLLGLAIATPALADEWGFVRADSSDVRLFYGVPDSHDVTLSFNCNPSTKDVRLVTTVLPRNARKGTNMSTKLSNGRSSDSFSGRVVSDGGPDSGSVFEARVPAYPDRFDVLKTGSTLTIEAGSARKSIPLRGISGPRDSWMQACLGRR